MSRGIPVPEASASTYAGLNFPDAPSLHIRWDRARLTQAECRKLVALAHSFICEQLSISVPPPRLRFSGREVAHSAGEYHLAADAITFHRSLPGGIEGIEAVGEEVAHYIHCKMRPEIVLEKSTLSFESATGFFRYLLLSNYMEAVGLYAGLRFAEDVLGHAAVAKYNLARMDELPDMISEGERGLAGLLSGSRAREGADAALHAFGYALGFFVNAYYEGEKLAMYFHMRLDRFVAECKSYGILGTESWKPVLEMLDLLGYWNTRLK